MIVVKVGGSLYDHPRLGPGLRAFLQALPEYALIVPGGGPFANVVRKFDGLHGLGARASHELALHAMNLAGRFLRELGVPNEMLDAAECLDGLPHSWDVTSDSIAAWAAISHKASRLVLLKSVDMPRDGSWRAAAECGWVDPHFPALVEKHPLEVEAINFRRRLDAS
ncbi:MAG TPA: hypothetical protein VGI99_11760 [Gemmataceae bacterium]